MNEVLKNNVSILTIVGTETDPCQDAYQIFEAETAGGQRLYVSAPTGVSIVGIRRFFTTNVRSVKLDTINGNSSKKYDFRAKKISLNYGRFAPDNNSTRRVPSFVGPLSGPPTGLHV